MNARQFRWLDTGFLLACWAIYLVNLSRYATHCDDAYISFRYAENFAHGHGLVYNHGEFVEGYTNFLWVVLASGSLVLGVPPENSMPVLGMLCGASLPLLTVALHRALTNSALKSWQQAAAAWLGGSMLAACPSLALWAASGLETCAFSGLAVGAIVLCLHPETQRAPWLVALPLAGACLMRPEGPLFLLIAGAVLWHRFAGTAEGRRRTLIVLMLSALPVVLHFAFRLGYYGQILPNTYYAKSGVSGWERGLRYLGLVQDVYSAGWVPVFAAVGFALAPNRVGRIATGALVAFWFAYLLKTGGDFLEFRFLLPIAPFVLALASVGVVSLGERLRPPVVGQLSKLLGSLLMLWSVLSGQLFYWADQAYHERQTLPPDWQRRVRSVLQHIETRQVVARYNSARSAQGKRLGELVRQGVLPQDLYLETGGAGALPYFVGWKVLDKRGLTDSWIAHQPPNSIFRVGHDREAPLGYLAKRGVDLVNIKRELLEASHGEALVRRLRVGFNNLQHWNETRRAGPNDPHLFLDCRRLPTSESLVFGALDKMEAPGAVFSGLPQCPELQAFPTESLVQLGAHGSVEESSSGSE